jgi:hypothetical protein
MSVAEFILSAHNEFFFAHIHDDNTNDKTEMSVPRLILVS